MRARATAVVWLLLASFVCGMASQRNGGKSEAPPTSKRSKAEIGASQSTSASPDGAKLFQTHCNRCHTAPDELSPRVARTVVQHMRVRGMLPEKDVRAILNYIAPE